MLNQLFSELLKKLKTENENNSTTKSGCFKFFQEVILEGRFGKSNFISAKSIQNYYEKFVERKINNASEPKNELKNIIAEYLGYKNYVDFEVLNQKEAISKTKKEPEVIFKQNKKSENNKLKIIGASVLVFIVGIFGFIYFFEKSDCIIWKENHFEEADCKNVRAINNKIYDIKIEDFKQINVTPNTDFFENKNPIVWYGKNANKRMEFFNHRGIHPETLRELKPITEYIINTYVYTNDAEKTIEN